MIFKGPLQLKAVCDSMTAKYGVMAAGSGGTEDTVEDFPSKPLRPGTDLPSVCLYAPILCMG